MKLDTNGIPRIDRIQPGAAIPGGDVTIYGSGFVPRPNTRPRVRFGETEANLLLSAEDHLVARVPEGAVGGIVRVETSRAKSQPFAFHLGVQIADNLHPVANPAVDVEGNIYVTYSGQRGQKVAVSLYKITPNYVVKPFVTELMNPTGLALDREGYLYVTCRNDGTVHRISPDGRSQLWVEGMGAATGIAFDTIGNLFVGDRSGTIFKISPDRQIFVFATLEPSISAYHLAFSPTGEMFVTGPTTSSFDRVLCISQKGEISTFFRGLGRPQGLAFDRKGNLYVAASYGGRRGIVQIAPDGRAEQVLGGSGLVGLALLPGNRAILATSNALFSLDWDVEGLPLPR
ncbi:MAG: IPT/TIG domain-containing protein [Acidobacteriia bacterium]|nr:IPT/TIG domain-containing protein [Terriglobia bacterium]